MKHSCSAFSGNNFFINHYILNLQYLPTIHRHKHIQGIIANSLTTRGIIKGKQFFFTSDNVPNVVKAINTRANRTRIPCFAHCFHLAIRTCLKNDERYEIIPNKCRAIVEFFARSTSARETFIQFQNVGMPTQGLCN